MPQSLLRTLQLNENHLTSTLPEAVAVMTRLKRLDFSDNALRGSIPDAFIHISRIDTLNLFKNSLSGSIPEALLAMTKLRYLSIFVNELTGTIPNGVNSLERLEYFMLNKNFLQGSIPTALGSLEHLNLLLLQSNRLDGEVHTFISSAPVKCLWGNLQIQNNHLQGHVPDRLVSLKTMNIIKAENNCITGSLPVATIRPKFVVVSLHHNELRGAVPIGFSLRFIGVLELGSNRLTGTLPESFQEGNTELNMVDLSQNDLAGALPQRVSSKWQRDFLAFIASDNRFAGTLPTSLLSMERQRSTFRAFYFLSRNLLEGHHPRKIASTVHILDIGGGKGDVSEGGSLEGTLPAALGRLTKLSMLLVHDQVFEGIFPSLPSTLHTLCLQNNFLTAMPPHLKLVNRSIMLMHNNHLSCHLPQCQANDPRVSLLATGNHWRIPREDFPKWVFPYERDGLFWTSEWEGRLMLLRIFVSCASLVSALSKYLGLPNCVVAILRWRDAPDQGHDFLSQRTSSLLACLASQSLASGVFLTGLLFQTSRYLCPRAFLFGSACLHEDTMTKSIVVLFFGRLSSELSAWWLGGHTRHFSELSPLESSSRRSTTVMESVAWLVWIPMLVVLCFPALVDLTCRAVPGVLQVGGIWLKASSLFVGALQALLSQFVIPFLAGLLSRHRYCLLGVGNLFTNFIFPSLLVFYLDASCAGYWTTLWHPCAARLREQFRVEIDCKTPASQYEDGTFCPPFVYAKPPLITMMGSDDVCKPVMRESVSSCSMSILLRLQDVWISKFVVSGFFIPAWRVVFKKVYRNAAKVSLRLFLQMQFAVLASGPLPLLVPLLLVIVTMETLITARSKEQGVLKGDAEVGVASASVIITQLVSVIQHAAFIGKSGIAMLGLSAVVVMMCCHRGLSHGGRNLAAKVQTVRTLAPVAIHQ